MCHPPLGTAETGHFGVRRFIAAFRDRVRVPSLFRMEQRRGTRIRPARFWRDKIAESLLRRQLNCRPNKRLLSLSCNFHRRRAHKIGQPAESLAFRRHFQQRLFFGRQADVDLHGPGAFRAGVGGRWPSSIKIGDPAAKGLAGVFDALADGLAVAVDVRQFQSAAVPMARLRRPESPDTPGQSFWPWPSRRRQSADQSPWQTFSTSRT